MCSCVPSTVDENSDEDDETHMMTLTSHFGKILDRRCWGPSRRNASGVREVSVGSDTLRFSTDVFDVSCVGCRTSGGRHQEHPPKMRKKSLFFLLIQHDM